MTLLPAPVSNDVHLIRGARGEKIPPAYLCAHPACMQRAQERHHLFRRSELAGAYDWIELLAASGDSVKLPNVIDLCREHHRFLTENLSWVKLIGTQFVWMDKIYDEWVAAGPLTRDVDTSLYCDHCGQPKPRPKDPLPKLATRRKKSVVLTVPDDSEDGAEVLDTLVDAICDDLGYDGSKGLARYHALTAAAAFTLQHRDMFLAERG
jgi:hypothetical protein